MALVTLVDTDSFQVPGGPQVYRCPVGKPEYTPPELQGARFADFDRGPEHDAFALAILIFQLLMQGIHPFAGRYLDQGEPAALGERIAAGHWPYVRGRRVPYAPNPHAPPFETLPPRVQELMRRCFEDGHVRSSLRPGAAAWHQALLESEKELAACPANPQHVFQRALRPCPWCALARRQGRDLFPSPEDVQAGRVGKRTAAPKPPEVIQVALTPAPMARDLVGRDVPPLLPVGSTPGTSAVAAVWPAVKRPSDLDLPTAIPVGAFPPSAPLAPSPRPSDLQPRTEVASAPSRRLLLWAWLASGGGLLLVVLGVVLALVLGKDRPPTGGPKRKTGEKQVRKGKGPSEPGGAAEGDKKVPAGRGDLAVKDKDKFPPKPARPPGVPPEIPALVQKAVRDKNWTRTNMVGFPLHTEFEEIPPQGGLLIGFEVTLGKFLQNDVINSIRPIYLGEKGEFFGEVRGKPTDRKVTVKAKKGYAVGAVTLNAHLLIDGMKVTFMRVDKKFLDPDDSYLSEPIGSIGGAFGPGMTVGGTGPLVIGICGRTNGTVCDALGLVLRGRVKQ
jgi:hypothetical protein